ncbi:MAG: udk [Pedosphaera sp.]|nr:udk [Pedosphaera sp.]
MKARPAPLLVAIVGGSGAGKSWLADQLQGMLGNTAARISLDDFYKDRSHLAPGHRARINFDHPRAIDWSRLERTLRDCLAWHTTQLPRYDFTRHARHALPQVLRPKPLILMDGLWLLRRPSLRRLFKLRIFIECPSSTRLRRRLARDLSVRGRCRASVQRQFQETVEPMNARYVEPQARWANILLKTPIRKREVKRLKEHLAALAKSCTR